MLTEDTSHTSPFRPAHKQRNLLRASEYYEAVESGRLASSESLLPVAADQEPTRFASPCPRVTSRLSALREDDMPAWFFVLLAVVLLSAVLLALTTGFGRFGRSGGQNTTIVERRPDTSDRQDVTIVEGD